MSIKQTVGGENLRGTEISNENKSVGNALDDDEYEVIEDDYTNIFNGANTNATTTTVTSTTGTCDRSGLAERAARQKHASPKQSAVTGGPTPA